MRLALLADAMMTSCSTVARSPVVVQGAMAVTNLGQSEEVWGEKGIVWTRVERRRHSEQVQQSAPRPPSRPLLQFFVCAAFEVR